MGSMSHVLIFVFCFFDVLVVSKGLLAEGPDAVIPAHNLPHHYKFSNNPTLNTLLLVPHPFFPPSTPHGAPQLQPRTLSEPSWELKGSFFLFHLSKMMRWISMS